MVGLEAMKGITWSRILSACDPLILAVCARALTYLETRCGDFLARGVPAFAIGVAVSALCWQKGLHLYSYLNFAGQIQFHGIRNLVQKPEADEGLVRTVTMRMWRPEPNLVAGVYGMNFDHMPELHTRYGYAAVMGSLLLTCTYLWRRFRKAGWL